MIPLKPSISEFRSLAEKGNLVPVWTELAADYETPVSAFQKLEENTPGPSFLLESAENNETLGRYSFLGSDPHLEIRATGRRISVRRQGETTFSSRDLPESEGDPLHEVERIMGGYENVPVDGVPVFTGGAVGFLAYDMVRFFEPTVPGPPPDSLGLPDMAFLVTDTLVIFDHRYRKILVLANVLLDEFPDPDAGYAAAQYKIAGLVDLLAQPLGNAPFSLMETPSESTPTSNTTREEYEGMVERAKEHILAGDIFQVVPSQRFEVDFTGRPLDLYRSLRHVNPSPYMFCLQFDDEFALVGSSPEVHVQSIDSRIRIRPIAGTRWRGANREEDDALAADLLGDPKERAEHVMLVDLARNDVGRVAEYESVEVSEFMIVERYSHVMHIVSDVIGRLDPGHSAYDVMRATFPAGTVSGSPKVRAMQIINELEKAKRGPYSGAIGYFGFDGNHDSCIALRTVVLTNGKAYVQAGAGVVADSIPANEYTETVNKAKGMIRAIERAKLLSGE